MNGKGTANSQYTGFELTKMTLLQLARTSTATCTVEYISLSLPAWNTLAAWVIAEYCLVKVQVCVVAFVSLTLKMAYFKEQCAYIKFCFKLRRKAIETFETLDVILQSGQWEDMHHQAMKMKMSQTTEEMLTMKLPTSWEFNLVQFTAF